MPKARSTDMEKQIRVRVLGRYYAVHVRPEEEARMHEVAREVEARIRAFRTARPGQSELTAAIITALTFADELALTRRAVAEADTSLAHAIDGLADALGPILDAIDEAGAAEADASAGPPDAAAAGSES